MLLEFKVFLNLERGWVVVDVPFVYQMLSRAVDLSLLYVDSSSPYFCGFVIEDFIFF